MSHRCWPTYHPILSDKMSSLHTNHNKVFAHALTAKMNGYALYAQITVAYGCLPQSVPYAQLLSRA